MRRHHKNAMRMLFRYFFRRFEAGRRFCHTKTPSVEFSSTLDRVFQFAMIMIIKKSLALHNLLFHNTGQIHFESMWNVLQTKKIAAYTRHWSRILSKSRIFLSLMSYVTTKSFFVWNSSYKSLLFPKYGTFIYVLIEENWMLKSFHVEFLGNFTKYPTFWVSLQPGTGTFEIYDNFLNCPKNRRKKYETCKCSNKKLKIPSPKDETGGIYFVKRGLKKIYYLYKYFLSKIFISRHKKLQFVQCSRVNEAKVHKSSHFDPYKNSRCN